MSDAVPPTMRWAAGASELVDSAFAAEEAVTAARAGLGDGPVDLAMVFLSSIHVPAVAQVADAVRSTLAPECLIGASGHGVVTSAHELEGRPSLSILAARLPGV